MTIDKSADPDAAARTRHLARLPQGAACSSVGPFQIDGQIFLVGESFASSFFVKRIGLNHSLDKFERRGQF